MAIQVGGYFPNPNNDSYIKNAIITLNVKQVPMGKLSVDCLLCVKKDVISTDNQPSSYLLQVSAFSVNDIDRTTLTFNEMLNDPYEVLLDGVQNYLIDKFSTENPELTFTVYTE